MAYVVGLMATDGCLLSKRRQLNFKSEDEQLVRTFLTCLGRPLRLRPVRGRTGNLHYVSQFSDAEFYRWLQAVGLMPRKSLLLGPIAVPDDVFFDLARGLLDGDGSIINEWYPGTGKAKGRMYEVLMTRFVSASLPHIEWLRSTFERLLGIRGGLIKPTTRSSCWALTYAIRESCTVLPRIYPDQDVPKLERKWLVWSSYAARHGHPTTVEEAGAASGEHELCAVRSRRDSIGRFQTLSRTSVFKR